MKMKTTMPNWKFESAEQICRTSSNTRTQRDKQADGVQEKGLKAAEWSLEHGAWFGGTKNLHGSFSKVDVKCNAIFM